MLRLISFTDEETELHPLIYSSMPPSKNLRASELPGLNLGDLGILNTNSILLLWVSHSSGEETRKERE